MKEALYYEKISGNRVHCLLCPRFCTILMGNSGYCQARRNDSGKLYSDVYGMLASFNIDPIEKKPFYHFLPGSEAFSFGTVGCNLGCLHCQNHELSRTKPRDIDVREFKPEEIVKIAIERNCKSIAYTYNEPTVNFEFVLDTAKLAKDKGIRNVFVTNGYINKEPLEELTPFIDAANIDIKAFNNEFYEKQCASKLLPVLEMAKYMKQHGVWVEITNLVIPTLNDSMDEIEALCKWISENLGNDTPIHFSRFFPYYKSSHLPMTPEETLSKARDIAKKYLNYVYVGNLVASDFDNTYCPKCKTLVIERSPGIGILQNNLKDNCCQKGHPLPGVWE